MANINGELAEARLRAGFTQVEIARKLGLTQARLSQIEHGQNARIDTLQSYARALGLELVLVPQRELSRLRSMLDRDGQTAADEERPTRFPSLAELVPRDAKEQRDRTRRIRESPR
jgi:transcriptional regulator with XRE-family HTH domain